MNIKQHCFAVLALTVASVGQLSAQTVTTSLNAIAPAHNVLGTLDGNNKRNILSGVMQFDNYEGFCIDPYQGIDYNNAYTYDVSVTFSTPAVSEAIARLVGGYYTSPQNADHAAAIQWAIWDVIIDGVSNANLNTGTSQALDTNVADLGNKYLANMRSLPKADVIFLTNDRVQDFVTVVPEPSSSLLLGLGIFGFLIRRKRA